MKNKRLLFILIGLSFLIVMLFVGTPFEFLNVTIDRIATFSILILFLMLFIALFKEIRLVHNRAFKRILLFILTLVALPYFYIGIWTTLTTWSNDHPMWQDLSIYTNDKNEKVITQFIEISGSLHDQRSRRVITEYEQFRFSFNCDKKKLKGIWNEYDCRNGKTTIIDFDKKE